MDSYSGIYYLIWVKSIKTEHKTNIFVPTNGLNNIMWMIYIVCKIYKQLRTAQLFLDNWEIPITVYPLGANE